MAEHGGDPVELYRARNLPEAYMVCNRLAEAGIPAEIVNDLLQGVVGEIPGGWVTAPRVMVSAANQESAHAIVDEVLKKRSDLDDVAGDRCLACGAAMSSVSVCPACGWSYSETDEKVSEPSKQAALLPDVAAIPVEIPGSPVIANQTGWGEVAAVLAVGVVPNLLGAISMRVVPNAPQPHWLDALNLTGLSACTIFVTLYLIRRSGEPMARFGLDRPTVWDFPLGLVMMIVAYFVVLLQDRIGLLGFSRDGKWFPAPRTSPDYFLMVVMYGFSAFAEELVTRAYLITRLETLLRSRGWAVVLSAAAFASYHAYQGVDGVVNTLMFGVVFGMVFLWGRRLWPLVIGHALWNIYVDLRM